MYEYYTRTMKICIYIKFVSLHGSVTDMVKLSIPAANHLITCTILYKVHEQMSAKIGYTIQVTY